MDKPACVAACLLVLSLTAIASERRDHAAHVHGVAELEIAAIGNALEIVFRSPAMNLVGFEHAPRTDAQRRRLDEALAVLRDGDGLYDLGDSGCRLEHAAAERAGAGHAGEGHAHDDHGHDGHGHDDHGGHGHDGHGDDGHGHAEHGAGDGDHAGHGVGAVHSELRALHRFRCGEPVRAIDVRLFERFGDTREIRARFVTDEAQGGRTLTPGATDLRLR